MRVAINHLYACRQSILALTSFHDIRSQLNKYTKDRNWLAERRTWAHHRKSSIPDDFLVDLKPIAGLNEPEQTEVDLMLTETADALGSLTPQTSLEVRMGRWSSVETVRVSAFEVLGVVSRSTWLNDSSTYFALCAIASSHDDVIVMDPVARAIRFPVQRIRDTRVVVFPINVSNVHWCAIYVDLNWDGIPTAFVYDPLSASAGPAIEGAWTSWVVPTLERWYARDELNDAAVQDLTEDATPPAPLRTIVRHAVLQPRQIDGNNCAVYCIGGAYCYAKNSFALQDFDTISLPRLALMRLQILHMLLCKTTRCVDGEEKEAAEAAIALFNRFVEGASRQHEAIPRKRSL